MRRCPARGYNRRMPVFDEKQEELEHYETMMGVPRGRLAVTMDTITDAMALVGQHGVYCQSQRWPGKPVMDIQIIMKSLTDAKELIQSVMEELKKSCVAPRVIVHHKSSVSSASGLWLRLYGFTVTITTPCDATAAENFPVNFPRSLCCHRSRTAALMLLG